MTLVIHAAQRLLCAALLTIFAHTAAQAGEPPRVVVSFAPAHSLAARVMAGIGAPELLLRPGASPHFHAMRPSEAEALQRADVVFWVGAVLEPWLRGPLRALAPNARIVALAEGGAADGAHRPRRGSVGTGRR